MIVGGAQENTLYTCQGHIENGHDVTLVTGPSPGPEGELLSRFCPDKLKVVEMPSLVRAINPWKDFKAYCALKKFFKENAFDVVHTHSSKAGVIGRLAARAASVPFVVHTVHGQAFHKYQGALKNMLYILAERYAAGRCDKIYSVCQAMIDQCVDAGVAPRDKYMVVYSGMDLRSFTNAVRSSELRKELGIPDDCLVVGKVARLFELKGHDIMVEAAAKIVAQFPNIRFLIVGDGILRESLENRARELGIADKIIFAGLIPPARIPEYIAQMDVVQHLSLREGLPRACVQALASAKPVVAYPLDGTPEVVMDGKTGFLVEPENVEQVADATLKLLKDASLRESLGRAGQEFVLQRFDWHVMADILEREYLTRGKESTK